MSDAAARAPARRRLSPRLVLGALLAVVLVATPWWAPRVLSRLAYFRVRRVEVVGARYVAPDAVLRRLAVDSGASVWQPPEPLERRVAEHPAIAAVRVRRRLPGTLVVEIDERTPVALVPSAGGLVPHDSAGRPLPIDPAAVDVDAPVLSGRDTALLRLLGVLRQAAPALYARTSDVRRMPRGDVTFRIGGMVVHAAEDVSLRRLLELEPVAADLARRGLRATEVDLRYRDQVIARLP